MERENEVSWNKWSMHVLEELKRHNKWLEELDNKINFQSIDLHDINIKLKILDELKTDMDLLKEKQILVNGVEKKEQIKFTHKYKLWMVGLTVALALCAIATVILALFKLK